MSRSYERTAREVREWAALVRELGLAASARELNLTPQAVADRVKSAEHG